MEDGEIVTAGRREEGEACRFERVVRMSMSTTPLFPSLTVHGNGSDGVFTQVHGDLKNETATGEVLDLEGVQDGWDILVFELFGGRWENRRICRGGVQDRDECVDGLLR